MGAGSCQSDKRPRFWHGIVGDAMDEILPLIQSVQQMVPQEWCLACRRCCRFPATEDVQTPAFSAIEVAWARDAGASSAWFRPAAAAPSHDVQLVPLENGYRCPALEPSTHRCQIYDARPLDCRLYPFVVTRDATRRRLLLAVDTQCPYVQHLGPSRVIRDYGGYLAGLLNSPQGQALLASNPALAGRSREPFWTVAPLQDPMPPALAPAPDGFRPLDTSAEMLEAALDRSGRPLSAYHRAAWWPWQDLLQVWCGAIGAHTVLLAEQAGGYFLALPPLGAPVTYDVMQQAWALLDTVNHGAAVSRMENVPAALAAACRAWGYAARPVETEYLYDRATLARRLDGAARRAARRGIAVRAYVPADAEACRRMGALWGLQHAADTSDDQARAMLRDGAYVHRRWLEAAESLGIRGMVAELDGAVCGYLLGVAVSPAVFVLLAEVTDREIPDVSAALTAAVCRQVTQPWFNAMGDAGVDRLARAKQAAHPDATQQVFVVTRK